MIRYKTYTMMDDHNVFCNEWTTYEDAREYIAACKKFWPKFSGYLVRIKEHIYA